MMRVMDYHTPVLLQESIEALQIRQDGVYVDLTFGGGGHSLAMLEHIREGKLYAFDQDKDAEENADRIDSKAFEFIRANFRYFDKYLKLHGIKHVDGILADLGVSSHQIDTAERGFSTRYSGLLDMRMDMNMPKTARQILSKYSEGDLHKLFGMYGEVRNAKTLANYIVKTRAGSGLKTNDDLRVLLKELAPRGRENKYFAQVFQALRIEVNDEMSALKEMLERVPAILSPGGKIVVISYHSLEDRLVKNFFNKGKFSGEADKDFYGNLIRPLKPVARKPVVPDGEEISANRRARSAKMRIAEKPLNHARK